MFNKLFENWRRFVDEQKLDELAKYKKMNKENSNIFDILKKYINIPAQYFIQFSDINKLGINPKSKYNTPIGIYSYPLIEDILNKYENESLPFASDRKYVILFKSKNLNAVVHFSIQDNEKYYEQLLNNIKINPIFDKYKDKNKNFEKYIEQWKKDAKVQTYDGYFWNITRMIANENPKIWTYILRNLNIDGMVDYGESIIHDNEPAQAVFFGKDKIEIIEVFENPYEKEELDLESNLLNISDKLSVFNMTFDKDIIEISTGTSISIDEFDKQKKNEYSEIEKIINDEILPKYYTIEKQDKFNIQITSDTTYNPWLVIKIIIYKDDYYNKNEKLINKILKLDKSFKLIKNDIIQVLKSRINNGK